MAARIRAGRAAGATPVGTSDSRVIRSLTICLATVSGSKRPPAAASTVVRRPARQRRRIDNPPTWASGSESSQRSSARQPRIFSLAVIAAWKARRERATPLGRPLDPEVGRTARILPRLRPPAARSPARQPQASVAPADNGGEAEVGQIAFPLERRPARVQQKKRPLGLHRREDRHDRLRRAVADQHQCSAQPARGESAGAGRPPSSRRRCGRTLRAPRQGPMRERRVAPDLLPPRPAPARRPLPRQR